MEHQTPIRKESHLIVMIEGRVNVLRSAIDAAEADEEITNCVIELNECEKVLDLINEHRERYEAKQEQVKAHGDAFRFGCPFDEDVHNGNYQSTD